MSQRADAFCIQSPGLHRPKWVACSVPVNFFLCPAVGAGLLSKERETSSPCIRRLKVSFDKEFPSFDLDDR